MEVASAPSSLSRRPTRTSAPTIDQARALVAVAGSPTYREAARTLGMGDEHIPLIRLIARLTQTLGAGPLVRASKKGEVSLTPMGSRVLPAARRMVEAADAMASIHEEIHFSAYPLIAARLIAAAPDLVEGNDPLVLSDISERSRSDRGRSLLERTATGELDIVVVPSGMHREAGVFLREAPLYTWQLEVVLPGQRPDVRARATMRPKDLAAFRIVAAPRGHKSRELLEQAFTDDSLGLVVMTESTNQDVLIEIAKNSHTIAAVLPSDAIDPPPAAAGQRPRLVSSRQRSYGGGYSLYTRFNERGREANDREARIEGFVERIASVFVREQRHTTIAEDLARSAKRRAERARR